MRQMIAIIAGMLGAYGIKLFGLGAGATWPGEIALRFDSHILTSLSEKIVKGIIVIAGTNGKTTTSLMIKKMLEDEGYQVLHNGSGANLLNGVVSAFFRDKRNSFDYAVFEVDENSLGGVLKQLPISQNVSIVLLNLFRDQLDRYGEVDVIAEKWQKALTPFDKKTTVIINADDPHLAYIGKNIHATVLYFGINDASYYLSSMQHATDTIYCPSCGKRLIFEGVYFSHLGKWSCKSCKFTHPSMDIIAKDVTSPLEGVYNIYNTLAATTLGETLSFEKNHIKKSIAGFRPAFGRMEEVMYQEKHIRILLSKNPTGFNESLRTALVSKQKGPMVIVLNDRIPDGTDVSWIWDVDFEQLDGYQYPLIISGDRALDMGVRLKYGFKIYDLGFKKKVLLEKNLRNAVEHFASKIKDGETGWILATYSAMLDVRKILTGRKIL